MKFKRKLKNISTHTIVSEIKLLYPDFRVSSVAIINLINTPEFWTDFVEFIKIQLDKHGNKKT